MKSPLQITAFAFPLLTGLTLAVSPIRAAGTNDQAMGCSENEHYCGHTVAMFMEGGSSVPPYQEGQCMPKEERCPDFWCGPHHCSSGFFGTPSVCCVNALPGQEAKYSCAYNELNCPGNTNQLSMRSAS